MKKGFELVQSTVNPDTLLLRVDADVLECNVRRLPYPTYIGTIDRKTFKVRIWSPAASIPRGYRAAAKIALSEAAEELKLDLGRFA